MEVLAREVALRSVELWDVLPVFAFEVGVIGLGRVRWACGVVAEEDLLPLVCESSVDGFGVGGIVARRRVFDGFRGRSEGAFNYAKDASSIVADPIIT